MILLYLEETDVRTVKDDAGVVDIGPSNVFIYYKGLRRHAEKT